MQKDLLVTLADKNYLEQAKQLFYGAATKGQWEGDMLLLACDIPQSDLEWFIERGIIIYNCPSFPIPVFILGKWSAVVLQKYNLFKTYFKQWKNVVFLDGDIIIRSSLKILANVKEFSSIRADPHLSDQFLDTISATIRRIDIRRKRELRQMYDFNQSAFNSGVFCFPTSLIDDDSFGRIVDLQERYGHFSTTADQGIMNLFFSNWKPLSWIYNTYPDVILATTNMKPADIKGIVLHFIASKPWHEGHSFYAEWKLSHSQACSSKPWKYGQDIPECRSYTEEEILAMELEMEEVFRKSFLKRTYYYLGLIVDKYIGLVGFILKKHLPKVYALLKGLKKT